MKILSKSQLENIQTFEINPEKTFTTKVNKLTAFGD